MRGAGQVRGNVCVGAMLLKTGPLSLRSVQETLYVGGYCVCRVVIILIINAFYSADHYHSAVAAAIYCIFIFISQLLSFIDSHLKMTNTTSD